MMQEDWNKAEIGKLCMSITSGRNKPRSFSGKIPWVTASEIQGRYLPSTSQENYISAAEIQKIRAKVVPEGSVVITVAGELGRVAITKEKIVLNQQLHAFVCPEYIQSEYLAYWLETQKSYVNRLASRTTVSYINTKHCESIIVHYPPLVEQNKITEVLLAWDKVIEVTERLFSNSQKQKKGLTQQLLTCSKRLPGFTDEWKEQALANWVVEYKEKSTFQDQVEVLTSSRQGLVPQDQYFKGQRITRRQNIGFNVVPEGYITYRSRSDNGSFTFNINDTGKAGIVSKYYPVFYFPQGVNKFFVDLFTLKESIFNAYSAGTSQKVLSISALKKIKMHIPVKQEQQEIVAILTAADNEVKNLQQRISCLKRGRKALMKQLFFGKTSYGIIDR